MRERYLIHAMDLEPRAFLRLTDNWMELSVILERFQEEGIELASTTVELVRVPPVEVRTTDAPPASDEAPPAHH